MPNSEPETVCGFCWKHPFQALLFGCLFLVILSPLFLSFLFEFRYTKTFAVQELERQDFKQVVISKKSSIGSHIPFPNTTEDWFYFTALENGKSVEGKLVCYRSFFEIEKARCEVELAF